eukprot:4593696-Alexandrium_andersonii.AAC.1
MCQWLQEYWERLGSHTPHPMNDDPALAPYRHCTFPLYWHSDGVEIYQDVDFTVGSWSSVATVDVSSYDRQNLSFVIATADFTADMYTELVAFLSWSDAALRPGLHPLVDHAGTPFPPNSRRKHLAGTTLANGWRGALAGWQADLKEKVPSGITLSIHQPL